MIPAWLFSAGVWLCYLATGVGALYLLAVLIRDWRNGDLW